MANYAMVKEVINTTDDVGNPVALNQIRCTFTGDIKSLWYAMADGQSDADAINDFKAKLQSQGLVLVD